MTLEQMNQELKDGIAQLGREVDEARTVALDIQAEAERRETLWTAQIVEAFTAIQGARKAIEALDVDWNGPGPWNGIYGILIRAENDLRIGWLGKVLPR